MLQTKIVMNANLFAAAMNYVAEKFSEDLPGDVKIAGISYAEDSVSVPNNDEFLVVPTLTVTVIYSDGTGCEKVFDENGLHFQPTTL